ncbi:MAG: hypothetical protein ACRDSR_20630 [Pseudonocardiaceae bacterium]
MSGDEERVVFDPELLDGSASELRAAYQVEDLQSLLASGLLDQEAFGEVPGAGTAHGRVQQVFDQTLSQTQRAGMDIHQLATDAMSAAQQARDAELATLRLALAATSAVLRPSGLGPLIASTIHVSTPGWAS